MRYRCTTLILLLLTVFPLQSFALETLTLACSLGSSERKSALLLRELTELTVKEAGYPVEFIEYPWNRVITSVKKGSIDGSYCLSYYENRKKWANFLPLPYSESGISFYKKASNTLQFLSLDQLLTLSIAVNNKSFVATELESLGAGKLVYVNDDELICRLLWADRVDLIVSNSGNLGDVFCSQENQGGTDKDNKVEEIGPPFTKEMIGLGLSRSIKGSQKKVDELNEGFIRLIKQNKVEKIYLKYGFPIPDSVKNVTTKNKKTDIDNLE